MKRLILVVILLLLTPLLPTALAQKSFLHNGVTAHRGNSSEFPENSMIAFESALALGVDWVELDVFLTADGQVIVTHDKNLLRVSGVDMEVTSNTYAAISGIDIAVDFRKKNKLSIEECPVMTIPLLEDVLEIIVSQSNTRLSIQPKMDCIDEVFQLIEKYQATAWIGFNDGNLELMKKVKSKNPSVPVFWDRLPDTDIEKDIAVAKASGFEALVIHFSGITADKVTKTKEANLEIGAWTVNDFAVIKILLDLGVERFYTDFPRPLLDILEENHGN